MEITKEVAREVVRLVLQPTVLIAHAIRMDGQASKKLRNESIKNASIKTLAWPEWVGWMEGSSSMNGNSSMNGSSALSRMLLGAFTHFPEDHEEITYGDISAQLREAAALESEADSSGPTLIECIAFHERHYQAANKAAANYQGSGSSDHRLQEHLEQYHGDKRDHYQAISTLCDTLELAGLHTPTSLLIST